MFGYLLANKKKKKKIAKSQVLYTHIIPYTVDYFYLPSFQLDNNNWIFILFYTNKKNTNQYVQKNFFIFCWESLC